MPDAQRAHAHDLLSAGLSQRGYLTATTIMDLETVLRALERGGRFDRDPELYFFTIFGTPSPQSAWGWRVEGHHLSLHFTIVDGTTQDASVLASSNTLLLNCLRALLFTLYRTGDSNLQATRSPRRKFPAHQPPSEEPGRTRRARPARRQMSGRLPTCSNVDFTQVLAYQHRAVGEAAAEQSPRLRAGPRRRRSNQGRLRPERPGPRTPKPSRIRAPYGWPRPKSCTQRCDEPSSC